MSKTMWKRSENYSGLLTAPCRWCESPVYRDPAIKANGYPDMPTKATETPGASMDDYGTPEDPCCWQCREEVESLAREAQAEFAS